MKMLYIFADDGARRMRHLVVFCGRHKWITPKSVADKKACNLVCSYNLAGTRTSKLEDSHDILWSNNCLNCLNCLNCSNNCLNSAVNFPRRITCFFNVNSSL